MANPQKEQGAKRIKAQIRKAVYVRDNYICQGCGKKVVLTKDIKTSEDHKLEASLDHIIPRSKGGSDEIDNLRTMCRSCNSKKGDKDEKELKFLNLAEGEYTRIHNALLLALARTKINTQEARILFAIIAKTYGYQKSEDWVSNSQLEEITGIHRCHCSGTVSRLKNRNIVTQTGNKIRINKYFFEWRMLPKQVTKQVTPKKESNVTQTGNQVLPKQVTTKENITKEKDIIINNNIQKEKQPTPKTQMLNFIENCKSKNEKYWELVGVLEEKGIPSGDVHEELDRFVSYWTELNSSGIKQRWELQKTFEVQRRLATWFKNYTKFNSHAQSQGGGLAVII